MTPSSSGEPTQGTRCELGAGSWELGNPRPPGLQGEWKTEQRAAHSEPVRGPFLQGLPKVKMRSDFSCSL